MPLKKNEELESNFASGDDASDSLALLHLNPGGIEFSDDLWMIDIPGVDQDLNLLQDMTLSDSFAAENLSIEVRVDEDT